MIKNCIVSFSFILSFGSLFAQPVTYGHFEVFPFGEKMTKYVWSHKGQTKNEAISNAVIMQGEGYAKDGGDIPSIEYGGKKIIFKSSFDSGHVRGFRFEMSGKDTWYGGGERATNMIRNGQRISLYNGPAYGYGEGQDQLNYSVPFILNSAGYGLFFDNPSRGYIDFGKTTPNILEAGFESGAMVMYVIWGDSPKEILEQFAQLTGKQPLPPRWALGNFVSRFGYQSQQQAEDVVRQMKKDGIPMDAIIIDLFWFGETIQYTLGNLDWNRSKWPQPEKMISGFKKDHINTILITEPFVLQNTKEYESSRPFLAKDKTGKPFELQEFYFGKGGIIDLFRKDAQNWFWQFYKKQNKIGVAGWWGDLGEPENHPEGVMHNLKDYGSDRMMSANEVHNLFGHTWSQMVYENWKKDYPEKRLFFLNRAGFAGSQRYSIFPWTGDVGRSWSGFRSQLPVLQSMSLSGIPYIHSDAGGFAMTDTADAELYLRWLQFAAYTPVFRPHGSALDSLTPDGTISLASEPAFWDQNTKSIAKKIIENRYRLLPYNYTLAWEQTKFGKPLIRPMVYHGKKDKNLETAQDQYFWGDAFLVAPVLQRGAASRKVYLPEGNWYRYDDQMNVKGGTWMEEKVFSDRMPVFVKGGSFIPVWDKKSYQSTADYDWKKPLTIRYFPGNNPVVQHVYDDDGAIPEAQIKSESHMLLELSGEMSESKLVIHGKLAEKPAGYSRKILIQIPVNALKSYIGLQNLQKWNLTINGKKSKSSVVKDQNNMNTYLQVSGIISDQNIDIIWEKK